jgi:hypothetical protein
MEPLAGNEKYERVRHLNAGAFGFVQLARNKRTGRHVAIKFLPRGERVGKVREEGRLVGGGLRRASRRSWQTHVPRLPRSTNALCRAARGRGASDQGGCVGGWRCW